MEIAALAISVVALLAAGWSAWGTHRQAQATEEQARAASAANATATEALALARAADSREQTRQHVEERPTFEVVGKRQRDKPSLIDVTIRNDGPLTYDEVIVAADLDDADTKRLIRGLNRSEELVPELALGSVQPGETLSAVLARTNPELSGNAKLIVTARRERREWRTIHYVKVARPQRIISM